MVKTLKNTIRPLLLVLFTALFINCYADIQIKQQTKTVLISSSDEFVKYAEEETIPFSETVISKDSLLVKDSDYSIDYTKSQIKILNTTLINQVQISFSFYDKESIEPLFSFKIIDLSDSLGIKTQRANVFDIWTNDSKFTISGSKTFSVMVGNQDDFSINQSMYLKLFGEISDNVYIDAQLNDSQSPITPEGNTKELSNIDEIYFRLYGKQYEIAFGDLEIEYNDTKFINYLNKFEGVKAKYFEQNEVQAAIAVSKSKASEMEFYGVDGKQGPYYLKPTGAYTNVKIMSGTEVIYLDSQLMQRGEDYFIDYDEGTISFQIKRIISAQNRIRATFQYSDENYRKNVYLFDSKVNITDELSISTHNIISVDDKKNPLSYALTDDDIQALKDSGDQDVYVAGERLAEGGFGAYKKVFDGANEYFVYSPGDSLAIYDISFTYVGENEGDYALLGVNSFEYVGLGLGNYMPIIMIASPEYKANWDFKLDFERDFFKFNYEILLSDYDKNTFSDKDSYDDFSYIHDVDLSFNFNDLFLSPFLNFNYREQNKYLETFASIENVDDYRFYYFLDADTVSSRSYSGRVKLNYYDKLQNNLHLKLINHDNFDEQVRLVNEFKVAQHRYFPELILSNTIGKQELENNDQLSSYNHNILTSYRIKPIKLELVKDYLENKSTKNDSVYNAYKVESDRIELSLEQVKNYAGSISFKQDKQYDWLDAYQLAYVSDLYTVEASKSKNLNTNSVKFARKNIDYQGKNTNQKYDFAEFRSNNYFLNSFIQTYFNYSISNLEYYPKIRELQYVGASQGFYDSLGVWSEDGEYDWVYALSGRPIQTIDLKADLNAVLSFNKLKTNNEFIKKLQLDTWFYVYETTEESNKYQVYLLNPNYLMQDSVSIFSKRLVRETLWYNHLPGKVTFKYVYNDERGLDNRYQEISRDSQKTHEYLVLLNKLFETDWEFSFLHGNEYDSRYNLDVKSRQSYINMKYVLGNYLIFNTKLLYNFDENSNMSYEWETRQKGFSEDIMYFLGDRYRFNSKVELMRNTSSYTANLYLPENKRKGTIFKWNNSVYYRFNQFTHLSLDYSGYSYPQRNTVHQIRMEVRAEF
ncbi:MAG: hypothetical protein RBS16_00920 [Candidatus Cloacimonadales bacterium]|nr:hypothetical protein [Candidatus Cloacimonadota bacterium]MDD2650861.1 hypothetical protein [Candidatus Cloacimonadota bacterium]MDX9976574.1 hypothetical protein [Candidatus Cloacimonadales bacterium]